jgi:hypothetical protein
MAHLWQVFQGTTPAVGRDRTAQPRASVGEPNVSSDQTQFVDEDEDDVEYTFDEGQEAQGAVTDLRGFSPEQAATQDRLLSALQQLSTAHPSGEAAESSSGAPFYYRTAEAMEDEALRGLEEDLSNELSDPASPSNQTAV